MQSERRTVSYIDDCECVQVFDPMQMDPEAEELLDQEWMAVSRAKSLQVPPAELRRAG